MRPILLAAAAVLLAPVARAGDSVITVRQVWSRAAGAGQMGVLYLTVTDTGAPDQLLGISTPVAKRVELHESRQEAGVSTMRDVAALPVGPGAPITLAPGGYHAMLVGLTRALAVGEHFPVTLTFAHAGAIAATATVQKPGAAAPMAGMPGMD